MVNVAGILILISIVLLILGLIKPQLSLFWDKKNPTRIKSSIIYGSILIISFIVFGNIVPDEFKKPSLSKRAKSDKEKIADTSLQLYTLTPKDYVKYFTDKWNSVTLKKEDGFPRYKLYYYQLDSIGEEMDKLSKIDSASSLTIKNLRKKFLSQPKFKKASSDYITYGEPGYEGELYAPCEMAIREILNDPSSLDVIDRKVIKQGKNGWIVSYRYRANNAFGARVQQVTNFEVCYDLSNDGFYVNSFR